jgi:hypothetical protein
LLIVIPGADAPPSPDVTEPPAQEEFLVIPLRIHLLQADDAPDVHCALTDDDMKRILSKINKIWHPAGIHFGLESLRREPAENLDRFRLARDLEKGAPASVGLFREILPEDSRRFDGLHLYYIHQFEVNGIYMGSDYSIVQETSALRPVEGGIDEPIPRVSAHELGHALGLRHRQDRTNLLASGTTGTLLNRNEVDRARAHAPKVPGVQSYAELRGQAEAAESRGERDAAAKLWGWLSEIPGDGADVARERIETLAEPKEEAR